MTHNDACRIARILSYEFSDLSGNPSFLTSVTPPSDTGSGVLKIAHDGLMISIDIETLSVKDRVSYGVGDNPIASYYTIDERDFTEDSVNDLKVKTGLEANWTAWYDEHGNGD